MADEPTFEVRTDADPGSTLLVSTAGPGMAGLTAADQLITRADVDPVGRVLMPGTVPVVPFAEGRPRHPVRLYTLPGADLSLLVSEFPVPYPVVGRFGDALTGWAAEAGVEEIAVLNGIPFAHGPEQHAVFGVATEAFHERRLADTDVADLAGGLLDGVSADLLTRSMEGEAPPTGVFVTPVHPPGPDLDAAVLFLDALGSVYGFDTDSGELRRRSEEIKRYYAELAEHTASLERERQSADDRAFM